MREKLAKLAHNQWSGWMEYLFGKCIEYKPGQIQAEEGALIIPKWAVERWARQAATKYRGLSPTERDSDRAEADKFLAVFESQLTAANEKAELLEGIIVRFKADCKITGKGPVDKDCEAVRLANEKIERMQEENKCLVDLLETRCVPAGTPPIVCLCGSTRFMDAFFQAGWKFTLEGQIVLSIGVCKHAEHHGGEALGQDVADKLDELHFRKIDLADSVFVLNVDGYIGESTRKEIDYAESLNKPISYLQTLPLE